MKVLFKKNVSGHGKSGEVHDVADAYARNFLIPQKLAQAATAEDLAVIEAQKRKDKKTEAKKQAFIQAARSRLLGQTLELTAAATAKGTLFAAIKAADILKNINKTYNLPDVAIDVQPDHLKTTGLHQVELRWSDGQTTNVMIKILPKSK